MTYTKTLASARAIGALGDEGLLRALCGVLGAECEKDRADALLVSDVSEMIARVGGGEDEKSVARVRGALASQIGALKRGGAEDGEARPGEAAANAATAPGAKAAQSGDGAKRSVRARLILPLAAAIALLAASAAITLAGGRRLADLTNAGWRDIKPGEVVTDEDIEIRKALGSGEYEDFSEMERSEKLGVLTPNAARIGSILVTRYDDGAQLESVFFDENGERIVFMADAPSRIAALVGATEKVGGFDVLLSSYDGEWQAEWIKDGVWYLMKCETRGALEAAIGSLEAGK